jgi:hypothetical protein
MILAGHGDATGTTTPDIYHVDEAVLTAGQFAFGATTTTYPRLIPVGGQAVALTNPLPTITGCSRACHEAHSAIFEKNPTAEGYVSIPRPMGPNCVRDSPPDDPMRNCSQR